MMQVNAVIGGEGNGGIIFPEHQYCRDGAMTVAKVLEIMTERDRKLSELVNEIPKRYMDKTKVTCRDRDAAMQHIQVTSTRPTALKYGMMTVGCLFAPLEQSQSFGYLSRRKRR
jgi:phosphomannomutase